MFGTTTPCPQLSTFVKDHRGKSLCSREVGCLAKCPNRTQAARFGGAGAWRFVWHLGPESGILLDLPNDVRGGGKKRLGRNVSVGQVVSHSLPTSRFVPSLEVDCPEGIPWSSLPLLQNSSGSIHSPCDLLICGLSAFAGSAIEN